MSALITSEAAIAKFGDAQGNVLKGHGRTYSTFLFFELGEVASARQWIGQLLAGLSTGPSAATDTVRITSTERQLRDRQKIKQQQLADGGLFTSLLFTAAGLAHLHVPALPHEAPDQAPGEGRADAFAAGMRAASTQGLLHDPAPASWDAGWRPGPGGPIHGVLLLADDLADRARLRPAVAFCKERMLSFGIRVRVEQEGTRLLEDGHDIEHFGYADGVSQPLYLTDDNKDGPAPSPLDTLLGAEELVFVPDRLSPKQKAWGSFVVFRKLEQDVNAFNKEEDDTLVAALHLPSPGGEDTKAFAGAMVVGRFENGTPLVQQRLASPAHLTNDFDYQSDPHGMRCPFHAHIRKTNPRGDTKSPLEPRHRITRRGVPYGTREEAAAGKPAGLLFLCYQRSIGQQFEFIQQAWANKAQFPHAHPPTGLDPVIGQGARGPLTFPLAWRPAPDDGAPTGPAGFGQHVTLRGGDYFYAPSMSGLAALAGVAT